MKNHKLHIRTRSARSGPELELLEAALKSGLPFDTAQRLVLREPDLPTGVPDLVAVEIRKSNATLASKRRNFQLSHFRILQFLNEVGSSTENDVVRLLNYPKRAVSVVVDDFFAADIITRKSGVISVRSKSSIFIARRIVAIEAKMHAWRDALRQATANLWFASHSFILLPALKCIEVVGSEAKRLGVGVLVFDGKRTRTVVRPRKHAIPASYGSWLINEWAIQQLK